MGAGPLWCPLDFVLCHADLWDLKERIKIRAPTIVCLCLNQKVPPSILSLEILIYPIQRSENRELRLAGACCSLRPIVPLYLDKLMKY